MVGRGSEGEGRRGSKGEGEGVRGEKEMKKKMPPPQGHFIPQVMMFFVSPEGAQHKVCLLQNRLECDPHAEIAPSSIDMAFCRAPHLAPIFPADSPIIISLLFY